MLPASCPPLPSSSAASPSSNQPNTDNEADEQPAHTQQPSTLSPSSSLSSPPPPPSFTSLLPLSLLAPPPLLSSASVSPSAALPSASSRSPFSSEAMLSHNQQQFRSILHAHTNEQEAFNPLAQPLYQPRAVHVPSQPLAPAAPHWFGAEEALQPPQLEGWASTNKHANNNNSTSHKQLDLLPLTQWQSSGPMSTGSHSLASPSPPSAPLLQSLPLFLEATCFSLLLSHMQPQQLWQRVQQQLQQWGVVVSERQEKPYQLDCYSTAGASCNEFRVAGWLGHFRDASPSPASSPSSSSSQHYTVEFQRRSGCCMAFMHLFRQLLKCIRQSLEQELGHASIDCNFAPALDLPTMPLTRHNSAPDQLMHAEGDDDSLPDIDPSLLAMPTLLPSVSVSEGSASAPPCISADCTLLDSLLDMLTSTDPNCHIDGMNALALCLSGEHPEKESLLLKEVAAKLQNGQSEQIRQVAASIIAKAVNMPAARNIVMQACMPAILASITAGQQQQQAQAHPSLCSQLVSPLLDGSFLCTRQKLLLRSCLSLSRSFPQQFYGLLHSEGAMRSSRLKRELLNLSAAASDAELRQLAAQAIDTIQA